MTRRHADGIAGRGSRWHVTVVSKDGTELLDHQTGDDEKECQAIATLAREKNLSTQIWITSPYGHLFKWA